MWPVIVQILLIFLPQPIIMIWLLFLLLKLVCALNWIPIPTSRTYLYYLNNTIMRLFKLNHRVNKVFYSLNLPMCEEIYVKIMNQTLKKISWTKKLKLKKQKIIGYFCNTITISSNHVDARSFKKQISLVLNFQIRNCAKIWSERWIPFIASIQFHISKLSGCCVQKSSGPHTRY